MKTRKVSKDEKREDNGKLSRDAESFLEKEMKINAEFEEQVSKLSLVL